MILKKQITTAKATIVVIGGLPEDAHNSSMGYSSAEDHIRASSFFYFVGEETFEVKLPPNEWQPLGSLKDIEEDAAKQLVVLMRDTSYPFEFEFDNYTEALHAVIETNCKFKNKYGEVMPELEPVCCEIPITDKNGYPECCGAPVPSEQSIYLCQLWQEEQSKIFTNPFLLKRI